MYGGLTASLINMDMDEAVALDVTVPMVIMVILAKVILCPTLEDCWWGGNWCMEIFVVLSLV